MTIKNTQDPLVSWIHPLMKLVNENQNKRSFSGIIISVVTIICILSLLGLTIYFVKDSGVIPKKTVEFEDLFNRKFIPRLVDVQWSSKSNVMYYFDNETNIISYNADRNDTEILLSRNYIFSFNITNFWVSFSGKYILMKSVTSKNNRHSTLGIYYIYNLIIGNIYTFPNKQKTSHLLLAKWAPNFDKIVYVKNTDIFISHLKKDLIINVSQEKINDINLIKNGISDWLYEEDVTNDINQNWWSPDGNYLAYIRFNMTYEPLFNYSIYQTTIPNDRWGYIEHQRYPIPHDPNIKILPITHVYIYHKTTKKIEFNLPYEDGNYYIYTNNWLNNTCLRTTFVDRAQKEYISYIVNILPDDSFKVIMENKEYSQIGWIDVPKDVIIYSNYSYLSIMPKAELNSEDIWNHVALINLESSHRNLKFLTSGRYDIISLVNLDKFRNILYVLSTGGDSKNQLLSRIDIPQSLKNFVDGSLENLLVDESDKYLCSYAKAKFSYNGNYHFMSCLGPNIPTFYVRSFSKKKVFIESNNECKKNLAQYDYYPKINYARIKRDNNIDIYMDIRQPQNNDTDLHPVLFYVYGGPGVNMVSSRWNFDFRNYLVSKYKIIIISIDARGTPRNGRKVEKAIYKKFGVVDVQDHTDAIEIISEKFVKIDKSKIGLFGISYGGYLTLNLLNSNSNLLNCGIAGSPVTDFRFYDAAYTEKYMGFPTTLDNYIGYERASIINNFNNIKKPIKLLLNHGSGDDNVHYINSAKLTDKLMKMNIDFTFQVYPDERHGIGSSLSISKYFWKKNIQFLLEKCWNFKNSSL